MKNKYLRRKERKEEIVALKGGKCCICGYNRYIGALQLHHLDPNKKDFNLGVHNLTGNWEDILKEVDKCILVCANCHCEIHADLVNLQ